MTGFDRGRKSGAERTREFLCEGGAEKGWGAVQAAVALGCCTLFALDLSVDNVASGVFLVLVAAGFLIGLVRGFRALLGRDILITGALAALLFAVAIASYRFGLQSDHGFRVLGRLVRLMLFLPFAAAIFWSRLHLRTLGLAVSAGAISAAILAIVQCVQDQPVMGMMGTHIVFGDLALLQGFIGAAIWMATPGDTWSRLRAGMAMGGLAAGLLGAGLADARGSWLAIVPLALVLTWGRGRRRSRIAAMAIVGVALITAIILVFVSGSIVQRGITLARADLTRNLAFNHSQYLRPGCVSDPSVLQAMLVYGQYQRPYGARARVVSLPPAERPSALCPNVSHALEFINPAKSGGEYIAMLRRRNPSLGGMPMPATVLASGRGELSLGKGAPAAMPGTASSLVPLQLKPSGQAGSELRIVLQPRQHLTIVPVQKGTGEYVFPLIGGSFGARLLLWQSAMQMFRQSPTLGAGTGAWRVALRVLSAAHEVDPFELNLDHAHDDYLQRLAMNGVLGLLAFLALLVWPVISARGRPSFKPLLITQLGIGICGLTETMFMHTSVITWWVAITGSLLVATSTQTSAPSTTSWRGA